MDQIANDILITGGTGFIGLALAKRILMSDKTASVILYGRMSSDPAVEDLRKEYENRLTIDVGEVRDIAEDAYYSVNRVYHLAAKKVTSNGEFASGILDDNAEADESINYVFGTRPWVKIVYASTGEVLGPLWDLMHDMLRSTDEWPVKDQIPFGAVNIRNERHLYALSKILGEARLIHGGNTARWSIARIQNPYGPRMGDRTLIPMMIRSVVENRPMGKVFEADTRPFIYIDDVADALIKIMDSKHTDRQTVNVAGKELMCLELIKTLSRITGYGILYTPATRDIPVDIHRALATDILHGLGWREWTTLEDGLMKTWQYYSNPSRYTP